MLYGRKISDERQQTRHCLKLILGLSALILRLIALILGLSIKQPNLL